MGHSRSISFFVTPPSPASRSSPITFPRIWRSVPTNFCTRRAAACASASVGCGLPDCTHAQSSITGHWSHAGLFAVQIKAPSSMSAAHIRFAASLRAPLAVSVPAPAFLPTPEQLAVPVPAPERVPVSVGWGWGGGGSWRPTKRGSGSTWGSNEATSAKSRARAGPCR